MTASPVEIESVQLAQRRRYASHTSLAAHSARHSATVAANKNASLLAAHGRAHDVASAMDDYVGRNREYWTGVNGDYTDVSAEKTWAEEEISWGVFSVPERELNVIGDVNGLDVVELGCGTAYFSAYLMRRGARPTGVDVTPAQLATARRCQEKFGLVFPLVEANAESVPLPAASFDLALSEYGACLWAEPTRWLREASRLLRAGGRLIFLTNSVLHTLCIPDALDGKATERLQRSQRTIRKLTWEDGATEFHPSHSEWIKLLGENGFVVERLEELYVPEAAGEHEYYKFANVEWGKRWPIEELWSARKLP